jgi:hypothetical protein
MIYPKGFTKDGYPLCRWGFTMKPRGIEYKQKRTKYACLKDIIFDYIKSGKISPVLNLNY